MGPKIIPDSFAIMSIDPGVTTGVGQGVFSTKSGAMLKDVLGRAMKKKSISTWHETGLPEIQAWAIANHWMGFRFRCNVEYGIPVDDIHLVMESFQLRQKDADLAPVEIIGGVKTLLYSGSVSGRMSQPWPLGQPKFQTPSSGKFISNAKLRSLGCWVTGSEHRRDAMRHIVAYANTIL